MKKKITGETIWQFKQYLYTEEKSPATIEKYIRDVWKFYHYLSEAKRFDKQEVLSYKQEIIKTYRTASVNSMLAALNQYLLFAGLADFRVKRLKVQKQIFRSEQQELTAAEYKQLLKAAGEKGDRRLQLIMLTICSTGIRVSELKDITVEAVSCGRAEVACKNKIRTIFIPGKIRKMLLEYAGQRGIGHGSVFLTSGGKLVDRSNIWAGMKRLADETGIAREKIYPHNLRHLFARTYYRQEKDIVRLADILGHSSVETTRIYTLSTGREHDVQISRLNLII